VNVQRVQDAGKSEGFFAMKNIEVQTLPYAEKQLTFCRYSLTRRDGTL
jgi:hypothetical protein